MEPKLQGLKCDTGKCGTKTALAENAGLTYQADFGLYMAVVSSSTYVIGFVDIITVHVMKKLVRFHHLSVAFSIHGIVSKVRAPTPVEKFGSHVQ